MLTGKHSKIILTQPLTPEGDKWKNNNNVKGEQLGVKLLTEDAQELRSQAMVRYMVSTILLSAITSWAAREDIVSGTTTKYVTNGAKRTVSDEPPTFGLKLPLSSVNGNYAKMESDGKRLKLRFLAGKEWVICEFNIPKKYQHGKIIKPDITIDKTSGKLNFNFTCQSNRLLPSISSDYIIGVDYGIYNFATWAVVNIKTSKTIMTGGLPLRLRQLDSSIKRQVRQISSLQVKRKGLLSSLSDYLRNEQELKLQRDSLSRKREELAKHVGIFLSGLSAEWDNAVAIREDLSHIKNTMMFGRWNRGRLDHWMAWKQEEAGGLTYKVNAAYTSQDCSECGYRSSYFIGRLFVCTSCGFVLDRDENAAVNIARRGISLAVKSSVTRDARRKSSGGNPPRPKPVKAKRKSRSVYVSPKLKDCRKFYCSPRWPVVATHGSGGVSNPRVVNTDSEKQQAIKLAHLSSVCRI